MITLALIFSFGLNLPALVILLVYAIYIFCSRKTLVIDWPRGLITCSSCEEFRGKIKDLVAVVMFEKHYKEGREMDKYNNSFKCYANK